MNIDLNRKDLISLVKGAVPNYSAFNDPLVKMCGNYIGGFLDRWDWDYTKLEELSDQDLFKLYNICKNSWK